MNRIVACALGFTVSCAPVPQDAPPSHAVALTSVLPPMRVFEKPVVTPARRSNTEIAQDFLDLLFRMESGRAVPQLTRFEGPITVRATGQTNL
ncbi:MAG: ATP-dependent transcriptional regulator, partial [Yoonia sp.]|nr:ATP-dependent transcriptional regulator [Yoonia sp.]